MRISDWSSDVCSSDLLIGRIVLVDLHLLQARDDRFLEMLRLDRLLGDLAQRDHRIFTAIAIERQIGAARDLPRTLRGEQHEIEPVGDFRSDEHTSELQSLIRTSYAVFYLKKIKCMCT